MRGDILDPLPDKDWIGRATDLLTPTRGKFEGADRVDVHLHGCDGLPSGLLKTEIQAAGAGEERQEAPIVPWFSSAAEAHGHMLSMASDIFMIHATKVAGSHHPTNGPLAAHDHGAPCSREPSLQALRVNGPAVGAAASRGRKPT